MRAAVYCGTRNLYKNMIIAAKSLLIHSNVEKIYFLIEDDIFPYKIPSEIECINISNQTYFDKNGPNFNSSWTYMVLIRAALSKIFPQLDTILSLDVDTIVNENISDLWNINLKNYYLAGVKEPTKSINSLYINMGVALFNLKKLREDKKDDEIINALNTIQYDYNEQDCINELCKEFIYELSPDYNITNYTDEAKHRKIIHFAAIKNWEKLPLVNYYATIKNKKRNQQDNYTLDIIIPTYNDKKGLIRTLNSIKPISNDVIITVIDDASFISYKKEIKLKFPYIHFIRKNVNEGPGEARQTGINITNAPYLMFIDSDDYLLPGTLNLILNKIKENTMPDVYIWRWLNEETNQFSSDWNPLMHGQVYKREFLKLYNITFCKESSYSNEDIGFNHTCDTIIKHIGTYDNTVHKLFCETPVYMYTYNKNSITHKNKKEFLLIKQIPGLAANATWCIKQCENNNVNIEILLGELNNFMLSLYRDFLFCRNRSPELLYNHWKVIKLFYLNSYKKYQNYELNLIISKQITSRYIKQLLDLNRGYDNSINLKRFLNDLNNFDIVPNYYYK